MAAGYLHTQVVELLLHYGSDPEVRNPPALAVSRRPDRQLCPNSTTLPACATRCTTGIRGSVLELVEGLKTQIPNDASVAQRRFALERCSEILTGTVAFFDRFGLLNFDLYEC